MVSFTTLSLPFALVLAAATQLASAAPTKPNYKAHSAEVLKAHNKLRAKHGAPALKWSTTLAKYAQEWTNKCEFQHSQGPYGENLAMGYSSFTKAINGWYNEESSYDYNNPGFGMKTGHFTQVVWKATTEVGCGVATCANQGNARLYVCSYREPGNMVGDNGIYFTKNVLPLVKK
ncbi:CAP domain-containing protein [Phycomyces nitens]|nr:CAP domain-containing protein [Phycomyces nitens]